MPSVIVLNPSQSLIVTPPRSFPSIVTIPIGPMGPPGPPGPPGAAEGIGATIFNAHINNPTPHPAYDQDIVSLTLLFENGLV